MAANDLADKLKAMNDADLTEYQGQNATHPVYSLFAEREFERRGREEQHKHSLELLAKQHELDLKLVMKQVRWMKFSAIIGIAGTIVGALLTAWLQPSRPSPRPQPSVSQAQKETAKSTSVDRKEKAESVPSKPLSSPK